jgi:RHS repeat-associated protein
MSEAFHYDEFGKHTTTKKEKSEMGDLMGLRHTFGFTGYRVDDVEVTGTVFAQAREYSPVIGRFISPDIHWNPMNMIYGDSESYEEHERIVGPNLLAISQSNNLYGYALDNPLMNIDLDGRCVCRIIARGARGIGQMAGRGANWIGRVAYRGSRALARGVNNVWQWVSPYIYIGALRYMTLKYSKYLNYGVLYLLFGLLDEDGRTIPGVLTNFITGLFSSLEFVDDILGYVLGNLMKGVRDFLLDINWNEVADFFSGDCPFGIPWQTQHWRLGR